jgi:cobalt-zinc-cadmium efflux system protein
MLQDIALILLEGAPRSVSVEQVAATLADIPVIKAARDIHVWCLSEEKLALSAHVQLARDVKISQTEQVLQDIKQVMAERYNITHINVQFELRECGDCRHTAL